MNYLFDFWEFFLDIRVMYGPKIKKMCAKQKVSQKELAAGTKTPESSVSIWINHAYPPLEWVEKVAEYFDIPLWQFFAPDDLVIPGLDPDEAKYMRAFKEVPTNVQAMMIDSNSLIYEAYLEGKKAK